MTFPGYTFAVQRLQKITNQKLDETNSKLSSVINKLEDLNENVVSGNEELKVKVEKLILEVKDLIEIIGPEGSAPSMIEEEEEI